MNGYLLFRRMKVDGVDYYQLCKILDKIPNDKRIGDIDNRKDKDFFFMENPNMGNESRLYSFFFDDSKGEFGYLSEHNKEYGKVYNAFKNKYHDFDNDMFYCLFRKIVIDGVNYYQIYDVVDEIPQDKDFADYFHRADKDYFVLGETGEKNNVLLHALFYDNEKGEFDNLTFNEKDRYIMVYNAFKEKFQDLGELSYREIKTVKELTNIVSRKVLFQEKAIKKLLTIIYLNQLVLASNLPDEMKVALKRNILVHGYEGTGKNTMIDLIRDNLNMPYADIKINNDLNNMAAEICRSILFKSNNIEEANAGIVFVRDNFGEMIDTLGDETASYKYVHDLMNLGIVTLNNYKIDFNKLTFVVLYNSEAKDNDLLETKSLCEMMNCQSDVFIKTLTLKQKLELLLSEHGRITEYTKYINDFGKKMYIDENSLKRLIKYTNRIDCGMIVLNKAIDLIVQRTMTNTINHVCIDDESVDFVLDFLDEVEMDYNESIVNNDDLDTICEKVKKTVVGQDKVIRRLAYNIMKNLEMANKTDLDNPSQYIKKILVQGESGGGKTLLLETIAKYLRVPVFIADATRYTETGFKGSDVEEMLLGLLTNAGMNKEKAERGILIIDEIDKKTNKGVSDQDISRGAVQNALLKVFDGSTFELNISKDKNREEIVPFNTSRLTIILGGAFENIEKIHAERLRKKQGVGFGSNEEVKDIDKKLTYDDYINYGMIKQFMARMKVFIYLDKNTKESLINIMKNSDVSALKTEIVRHLSEDIALEYTEDFYEKLAERALSYNIGVRGIGTAFEDVLEEIKLEDINPKEVEKIIFTGDVVNNPNAIVLVPRDVKKKVKKRN